MSVANVKSFLSDGAGSLAKSGLATVPVVAGMAAAAVPEAAAGAAVPDAAAGAIEPVAAVLAGAVASAALRLLMRIIRPATEPAAKKGSFLFMQGRFNESRCHRGKFPDHSASLFPSAG